MGFSQRLQVKSFVAIFAYLMFNVALVIHEVALCVYNPLMTFLTTLDTWVSDDVHDQSHDAKAGQ